MPNKVIAKIGLQTSTLVVEVECKEDEYKCGNRRLCKTCDTGSVSHSLSHCLVTPESAKNTRVQSVCFDIKKKWAVRHSIVLILKVFFFPFSSVARRIRCVTCRTTVEMVVMNKDAVSFLIISYSQSLTY